MLSGTLSGSLRCTLCTLKRACTTGWVTSGTRKLATTLRARADKGWAVKRARPSKEVWCSGLGLCLGMSLVFDFGQGLRCGFYDRHCRCHWIMAAWFVFLHFFLVPCAGTLSPRGKCCYFCGRFSWSRQTSLSKGFFYYFHDSTTELYFRSATRQCRCYSKTKTTKYCLKHEGKSFIRPAQSGLQRRRSKTFRKWFSKGNFSSDLPLGDRRLYSFAKGEWTPNL